VTEPGEFEILAGTSSRNILLRSSFYAKCRSSYEISGKTEIVNIIAEPGAMEVFRQYLPQIDLKEAAGTFIVFLPFKPFEEIWQRCIVPELPDRTAKELEEIYGQIIAGFKKLSY